MYACEKNNLTMLKILINKFKVKIDLEDSNG